MDHSLPKYQLLEDEIEQGIVDGRWKCGERLPSIRTLCDLHGCAKITIQHALQRLEAKGLIESRERAGFFVTYEKEKFDTPCRMECIESPKPVSVSELFRDIMTRSAAFDLTPNLHTGEMPQGIVQLNRSIGRALRRQKGDFQYYDEPAGDPGLRHQLAMLLAKRGWTGDASEVCITSGCQQSIFLALLTVCSEGDVVAVESPGFYGVLQLLEQLKLKVIEVPTSLQTGMDINALSDILNQWNVRACVVQPAFATPGGSVMPRAARTRLIELAEEHDLAIIEDDIYAETGWAGIPDTLKSLDHSGRVIHCSSLSKVLSRDLRLGWVCGGRWHSAILQMKLTSQLASSRFVQQGVETYIKEGDFAAFLRKLRFRLRKQRDQLLEHLANCPLAVRTTAPQGGLAVWVEFPGAINTIDIYSKALDEGIVITPGNLFSGSDRFGNCLRISFAHPWDNQRTRALTRILELVQDP
ncbi:PLP-dependent aminotransferase family protein [Marinobacter litoralis]|uniref:aminotransferase-like domain-containing protein n=1 Tax=Marinobacter litoralis TaxID=187981 RepID=UPI0018EC4202|nr:PLP-dependent aminotransferase family protein [Marinobacter litoralis]MBJ6138934.1 PLP-dependent aminotransferase family protein [Marinobacter litoralis]